MAAMINKTSLKGPLILQLLLVPVAFALGCGTQATSADVSRSGLLTADGSTSSSADRVLGGEAKWEYVRSLVRASWDYTASNLAELEAKSVAIAEVVVGDSQPRIQNLKSDDTPTGNTLTRVTVEKAIKSDGRMTVGADYAVIEYYVTMPSPRDPGTTMILATGNVFPMAKGGRYLLFLGPASHDYGDYEIFGLWIGQFKVSEEMKGACEVSSLTKEQLGAAWDKDRDPRYWAIAQEVKDKYLSQE
jgi:hypothetical protein